jgi:hypothetical protein
LVGGVALGGIHPQHGERLRLVCMACRGQSLAGKEI